jgi:hypothetical protein
LNGNVAPRNIDGLDSSAQARDNFMFFISGALVALGGTALLGAFQEYLAVRNRTSLSKNDE